MNGKNNLPDNEERIRAFERTRLARVRMYLARIRTILAVVVFTVVMLKIMSGW